MSLFYFKLKSHQVSFVFHPARLNNKAKYQLSSEYPIIVWLLPAECEACVRNQYFYKASYSRWRKLKPVILEIRKRLMGTLSQQWISFSDLILNENLSIESLMMASYWYWYIFNKEL